MFYLSTRRGVGEVKLGFFALKLEFLLISHVNLNQTCLGKLTRRKQKGMIMVKLLLNKHIEKPKLGLNKNKLLCFY